MSYSAIDDPTKVARTSQWKVECQLDSTYIFFNFYVEAVNADLARRSWQIDALNELLPSDKQIKVIGVDAL